MRSEFANLMSLDAPSDISRENTWRECLTPCARVVDNHSRSSVSSWDQHWWSTRLQLRFVRTFTREDQPGWLRLLQPC